MPPPSCLPHASALKATPVQRFPVGPGTRLSWRKRVVSCSPRCSQPWDMQLEKSPCQGGTNGAGNAGMQQSRQRGTRLLDGQKKSCRKSHKVPKSSGKPSAEVSCTLVPHEVQLLCIRTYRTNDPAFSIPIPAATLHPAQRARKDSRPQNFTSRCNNSGRANPFRAISKPRASPPFPPLPAFALQFFISKPAGSFRRVKEVCAPQGWAPLPPRPSLPGRDQDQRLSRFNLQDKHTIAGTCSICT